MGRKDGGVCSGYKMCPKRLCIIGATFSRLGQAVPSADEKSVHYSAVDNFIFRCKRCHRDGTFKSEYARYR